MAARRNRSVSALIDGASWWNHAFEAAGFKSVPGASAARDADPMDVRYNVIHWVHRSTRGWSYGEHRYRSAHRRDPQGQRPLGLAAHPAGRADRHQPRVAVCAADGADPRRRRSARGAIPTSGYLADADPAADIGALSLARSASSPRTKSAMPLVRAQLRGQHVWARLSHGLSRTARDAAGRSGRPVRSAYATSSARYDEFSSAMRILQFAPGTDEPTALDAHRPEGTHRPPALYRRRRCAGRRSGASPRQPLGQRSRRGGVLSRSSSRYATSRSISSDCRRSRRAQPLSLLEARLLPLYLHHRYQLQAALKSRRRRVLHLCGAGHGSRPADVATRRPAPRDQRRALDAVLDTLEPAVLVLPPADPGSDSAAGFGYRGSCPSCSHG